MLCLELVLLPQSGKKPINSALKIKNEHLFFVFSKLVEFKQMPQFRDASLLKLWRSYLVWFILKN